MCARQLIVANNPRRVSLPYKIFEFRQFAFPDICSRMRALLAGSACRLQPLLQFSPCPKVRQANGLPHLHPLSIPTRITSRRFAPSHTYYFSEFSFARIFLHKDFPPHRFSSTQFSLYVDFSFHEKFPFMRTTFCQTVVISFPKTRLLFPSPYLPDIRSDTRTLLFRGFPQSAGSFFITDNFVISHLLELISQQNLFPFSEIPSLLHLTYLFPPWARPACIYSRVAS